MSRDQRDQAMRNIINFAIPTVKKVERRTQLEDMIERFVQEERREAYEQGRNQARV